MSNILKKDIEAAFDSGKLSRTEVERLPDEDLREHAAFLTRVDDALHNPPQPQVPDGFLKAVMRRLPASAAALRRIRVFREIFVGLSIIAVLVLSLVFSDFFGLSALGNRVSTTLESAGDQGYQTLFILLSAGGMLFSAKLMINSFFGIRSRRVTR